MAYATKPVPVCIYALYDDAMWLINNGGFTCEFLNSEKSVNSRCSDCIRDLCIGISSNPATHHNANVYSFTVQIRRHSKGGQADGRTDVRQ